MPANSRWDLIRRLRVKFMRPNRRFYIATEFAECSQTETQVRPLRLYTQPREENEEQRKLQNLAPQIKKKKKKKPIICYDMYGQTLESMHEYSADGSRNFLHTAGAYTTYTTDE